MSGVMREIVIAIDGPTAETKDPWGNFRRGASATATLNRKDWGLVWNQALETSGVLVGDEVAITPDIEAVRSAPAKPTPGSAAVK
jgi:polyisoprenoid-binding protein YceI